MNNIKKIFAIQGFTSSGKDTITSRVSKTKLPTHIDIYASKVGLAKDSVVLLEQIRTIDKKRLKEKMGHLDDVTMGSVNNAIEVSFGLQNPSNDSEKM